MMLETTEPESDEDKELREATEEVRRKAAEELKRARERNKFFRRDPDDRQP